MTGTPTLVLCLLLLAHPLALWRLTRLPGEGPRQWLGRYEPLDWPALRRDVLRHAWVGPGWWLRYLFGVVVISAILPWAMALFVVVSGQWRLPGAALEMVQMWVELVLILTVTLFLRVMHHHQPAPVVLDWRLVGRWLQVWAYALAALQAYGAVVAATRLPGLDRLVAWRWF